MSNLPPSHTCTDRPHLPCDACAQKNDYTIAREDLIRQACQMFKDAELGSEIEFGKIIRWLADQLEAL